MAKRSALAKQHHLRLTSSPVPTMASGRAESPLGVRTRLRERRPVSVKRHTARIATRLGVLVVGDVAAMALCAAISALAATSPVEGRGLGAALAEALEAGYWTGLNFGVAVILSLAITGNYSRHRRLNGRLRLLAASFLASATLLWGMVSSGDLLGALVLYLVAGTLTGIVLLAERTLAERFLSSVYPGKRGAAPAVLVTDRSEESVLLERAVIAAGGDYSLAGYVPV